MSISSYQSALLLNDRRHYVNLLDLPKLGNASRFLKEYNYEVTRKLSFPWFADVRYCWNTTIDHKYNFDIASQVLESNRLSSLIKSLAEEKKVSASLLLKQASKFLYQMKASFNKVICKAAGYIFFKLFRRITRRILVSPPQMERLRNADGSGTPILYLPLHRSHLDHMLITWSLYHWGIRLPHIASGDNLNLNGLGWLLRAFGAFFIRRKVDNDCKEVNEENNTGNELYREVLNTYMTSILKHGMSIEFFLEGTRSRFGKALLPKNGLISNIVAAVRERQISDVFIVPVSIAFDQIIEGVFYEELIGVRKKKESVIGAIRSFFGCFGIGRRCGTIVLDFGTPISLYDHVEILSANILKHKGMINLKHETNPFSYRELLPWHHYIDEPLERMLIRAVGYDAVFKAQLNKPINIPALISMLLLCRYRKHPVLLSTFLPNLQKLIEEVNLLGFHVVGWNSERTDIRLLFEEGYRFVRQSIAKVSGENGEICLQLASDSLRCHLDIAYRKNNALAPFCLISMIALSILSFTDREATFDEIVGKSFLVCNLLQCEIIFCSPTDDLRMEIVKALEFFGIVPTSSNRSIVLKRARFELSFYSNILRPFLQTLLLTIVDLVANPSEKEISDREYVRNLLVKCMETSTFVNGNFPMCEALNSDSMHNAIKFLRFKQVILKHGMKLIDRALAEKYIRIIREVLTESDGPPKSAQSQPVSERATSEPRSDIETNSS